MSSFCNPAPPHGGDVGNMWIVDGRLVPTFSIEFEKLLCLEISQFSFVFSKLQVTTIDNFDATSIVAGLRGVVNYVQEQWGK